MVATESPTLSVIDAGNDVGFVDQKSVNEDSSWYSGIGAEETSDPTHSIASSSDPNSDPTNNITKEEAIAQAENQAVFRIRLLVVGILVSLTVCVAFLVFYFSRSIEVDAFHQSVLENSEKIFESIGATLDASLGNLDSFAYYTVSQMKSSNSSWPFVDIPDCVANLAKVRALSKAFWIAMYVVVEEDERAAWESFSYDKRGWVDEAHEVQRTDPTFQGLVVDEYTISRAIYNNSGLATPNNTGPYYPTWYDYPNIPLYYPAYNWDGNIYPSFANSIDELENDKKVVIGGVANLADPNDPEGELFMATVTAWLEGYSSGLFDHSEPYSDFYYPIFQDSNALFPSIGVDAIESKMVGALSMSFYWRNLIENIMPPGSDGTIAVFENPCSYSFTYQINGPDAIYKGQGDLHDAKYDGLGQSSGLADLKDYYESTSYTGYPISETCPYTISIYPSQEMEDQFLTTKPTAYMAIAVAIFLVTSVVFYLYDVLVERRQKKVMKSAVQSNAIVSSLFPSNVRKRLFDMDEQTASAGTNEPQKTKLKTWLSDGKDVNYLNQNSIHTSEKSSRYLADKPIADLFPEATVLFADIAGFTAWSSIREPSQVFILLENLYGAFDKIAMHRGVFKVETIGDSYVAVAGLPEPRADHAVVMVKFAHDCRLRMNDVTRELGVTLGPDTEDLSMRFGLHSGPVTAGVLRGQKSRFQLFGDTVNTAARMESTGSRHMIQVSQTTADQIIKARKKHWIIPRDETVEVKGKGMMQTYWANPKGVGVQSAGTASANSESMSLTDLGPGVNNTKLERLIEWNIDVLARLIRHIIHRRNAVAKNVYTGMTGIKASMSSTDLTLASSSTVLDEVKEIIELPDYDGYKDDTKESGSIVLDPAVTTQLREYVVAIAMSYEMNAFHNFEHASHVCMSVAKLMSRIVAADDVYEKQPANQKGVTIESTKHDHTYGITSDPLTQFACVFSALIHDAEHPGVPNTQLVKEGTVLAQKYNGRSVAEQNSVDIAWSIFLEGRYSDLRTAICPTDSEMKRFRQLVVNCVMATDIMDKDLKTLRNARWETAFSEAVEEPDSVSRNRKATIVIEHLIQASDVAHTMQHWHIYRKWNERLFEEMYRAYKEGRSDKDPAEFWYKGEMGFFDFYIVPLAKKLSDCGVFGVSSDEYLNYAMKNREEWERRGEEVVTGMVKRLNGSEKKLQMVSES